MYRHRVQRALPPRARLRGRTGAAAGRGRARRRGSSYAFVLIAIPVLLGMAALAIDTGRLAIARQDLQAVADAAALAGAGRVAWGPYTDNVVAEVMAVVQENSVLNESVEVTPDDIIVGLYDPASGTMVPGWPSDRLPQVQVTVRLTADSDNGAVPMTLSRLFGIDEVPMTVTAVAGLTCAQHPRLPVELAIVQDCSGSFQEEIEIAKDANHSLVDLIDDNYLDGDGMAVCAFNTSGWKICMGYIPNRTDRVHWGINQINNTIPIQGYTYTELGIQCAHELLNQYGAGDDAEQVIVLLSDGMPNPSSHRAPTVAACDAAAADNIRIHTVTYDEDSGGGPYGAAGADADYNASLVRNGGFSFHTPDPEVLAQILEGIGAIEIGQPMLIR